MGPAQEQGGSGDPDVCPLTLLSHLLMAFLSKWKQPDPCEDPVKRSAPLGFVALTEI